MPLNSSSINTESSTTTDAVNKKTDDTIEKNLQTTQKMIKIQLQTLLFTTMLDNLKHKEKNHIFTSPCDQVFLVKTPPHK